MINFSNIEIGTSAEQEANLAVANRINHETRANPASPYTGKYIGVWHEEVVAVGANLDEVCRKLDELGDKDFQAVCLGASIDYETPVMIWGVR